MWPVEITALRRLRSRLAAGAQGQVLEIGAGTGANFSHYAEGAHVFALDASADMLGVACRRPCRVCTTPTQGDGQALPFANEVFDTALATFVFCSVPDPLRALVETRRVLRPGGKLLLMEHTRGIHPFARWFTDTFHPLWLDLQGSCHLNRETAHIVTEAGFSLINITHRLGGALQLIQATK